MCRVVAESYCHIHRKIYIYDTFGVGSTSSSENRYTRFFYSFRQGLDTLAARASIRAGLNAHFHSKLSLFATDYILQGSVIFTETNKAEINESDFSLQTQ